MRLAAPLTIALLAAALLAGCGSSDGDGEATGVGMVEGSAPSESGAIECNPHADDAEDLRVTGLACPWARTLMFRWQNSAACGPAADASRGACRIGDYRCRAKDAARGVAVSCSQPGRSVAFLALG